MKKNVLVLLFLASATISVSAQKINFGIKGGVNIANISNTDSEESLSVEDVELFSGSVKSSSKIGFVGGLYANIGLGSDFSVQPELLYSSQGVKISTDFGGQIGKLENKIR